VHSVILERIKRIEGRNLPIWETIAEPPKVIGQVTALLVETEALMSTDWSILESMLIQAEQYIRDIELMETQPDPKFSSTEGKYAQRNRRKLTSFWRRRNAAFSRVQALYAEESMEAPSKL
jgi:hypothetical protein